MPQTPLPHGEPRGSRGSQARWFEPIVAREPASRWFEPEAANPIELRWFEPTPRWDGAAVWFEPTSSDDAAGWTVDAADEWCTAPDPRRRDAVSWKEVRWVGFARDADRLQGTTEADLDAVAAPMQSAPEAPEEAGSPDSPRISAADLTRVSTAEKRRRWPAITLGKLLKVASAVIAVVVLAGSLYRGGQLLAKFAAATPQAQDTAARVVPQPRPALPGPAPAKIESVVSEPSVPRPASAASARKRDLPETASTRRAAYYLARAGSGEASAEYDIGVLYARGDGVTQDFAGAASWFRKAARDGNAAAEFNLGVLYERGLGVHASMVEAVAWYRRAAARNYSSAQYNLAIAYAEGRGAPKDWVAAAHLYHDAAAQGLLPAMINFAILCERGDGIRRSLPEAYAWYRAAARRGDVVATQRARELFEQMDVSQKGPALMLASATADALHDATPTPSAPTVPNRGVQSRRAMEPGGWLGGAAPATGRQTPSG